MTDELVERLRYLSRVFRKHDVEELTYDDYLSARLYPDEAADRIEALTQEVKDLKKLAYAAYCEGFSDGKDGGWIVGPSNQPWKASDAHRMLKTMEAKP